METVVFSLCYVSVEREMGLHLCKAGRGGTYKPDEVELAMSVKFKMMLELSGTCIHISSTPYAGITSDVHPVRDRRTVYWGVKRNTDGHHRLYFWT